MDTAGAAIALATLAAEAIAAAAAVEHAAADLILQRHRVAAHRTQKHRVVAHHVAFLMPAHHTRQLRVAAAVDRVAVAAVKSANA
jgi:hypothetical protein